MMQCQLHQSVWMDQSFSGGSCPECTKERKGYVQQINKLTIDNREVRAQFEAISLECIQLRNQLPAWIPCSAMMPPPGTHCLVFLCWDDAQGYIGLDSWSDEKEGEWDEHSEDEISHWMYLPESPANV